MTASDKERPETSHPTPLRMSHARWCVGMYSNEGDTIVDPFCGSGFILRAGVEAGCDVIGCDINESFATEARQRIDEPFLLDGLFDSPRVALANAIEGPR